MTTGNLECHDCHGPRPCQSQLCRAGRAGLTDAACPKPSLFMLCVGLTRQGTRAPSTSRRCLRQPGTRAVQPLSFHVFPKFVPCLFHAFLHAFFMPSSCIFVWLRFDLPGSVACPMLAGKRPFANGHALLCLGVPWCGVRTTSNHC